MARTGNVYITINGKDNVSKTLKQVNKGLGGLKTSTIAVGTAMGNILGNIATNAVGALTDQVGKSINAARDLNETISKTNVVFGDSADQIHAFAETASTAFGQSKRQALDAASGFAVFGQSAGLSGDDLVGFSTDLTGLASDIASFSNTSVEEAITAISAGLRGESLPLRKYGVLLDEATLRARAFQMGLIETTKNALTPQQKVLAAQAEILAQTNLQQGDFARTSDGLANKQRILAARIEDVQSAVGQALLPVALQLTDLFMDRLLPVLEQLGKPLKELIDNTSAAAGTIGKELGPTIESIVNFLFKEFIPAVVTLAKRVGVGLLPIIKTAAGFIKNTVIPVFQSIAAVVVRDVLPIIGRLADFFITRVLPAASTVAAFLAGVLGPIFRRVADVITQRVIPVVVKLANFFVNNVLPVIADLAGALWGNGAGPLPTALNAIAGVFGFVADAVGVLFGLLESLLDILGQVAQAIANSPIGQIAGAIGGFIGDLFGGERARGGPVAGGKAYLVGERGPELFVPGQTGSIVPNTGLAMPAMSAGGAGGVGGEIRRAFAGLGIYLDGESVGRVSDRRLAVALATTGTTGRSSGAFRYGR